MFKVTTDIIEKVFDRLPKSLLDDAHREKLKYLVEKFPLVQHGIIELYNTPKSNRVDLMLCVQKKFEEHHKLATYADDKDLLFLKDLLALWTDNHQMLSSVLENIYMVYDLENLNKAVLPWPYLAFSKLALQPFVLLAIFKSSVQSLNGIWSEAIEDKLLLCLESAAPDFHVFGFGMLEGRQHKGFRIGISNFTTIEEITQYLERIAWPVDFEKFSTRLIFLDELVQSYVLSLVIEEGVSKVIGIECVLSRENNGLKAQHILQQLDVEEIDVLVNAVSDKNSVNTWINHVKVNYEDGEIIGTKSYLYYELIP